MLQRGEPIPHFAVNTLQGGKFTYSTIWQRKNLVLVAVAALDADETSRYVTELATRKEDFASRDAECVITQDSLPGIPAPAALVADRWGEVVHVAATSQVSELPPADELLDWLDYLQTRCPECEGEAK